VVFLFTPTLARRRGRSPASPRGRAVAHLLALQLAAAARGNSTTAATLVFDEVDAGIGGAEAAALGKKLQRLARGGQILASPTCPSWRATPTPFQGQQAVREGRTPGGGPGACRRGAGDRGGADAGRQGGDRPLPVARRGADRGRRPLPARQPPMTPGAAQVPVWHWGDPVEPLAACLERGGLIAIPRVELRPGGRSWELSGVAAVYRLKGRSADQPLPVVVAISTSSRAWGSPPISLYWSGFRRVGLAHSRCCCRSPGRCRRPGGGLARRPHPWTCPAAQPPGRSRPAADGDERQPERRGADPRSRRPPALLAGFDAVVSTTAGCPAVRPRPWSSRPRPG